jgi:uncharacterized membrane protein YcaP (DUF421 family)
METVLRVVIVYLFVLAGLRILGKREFGQLAPMELVVLLLIPELVSQALVGEDFSLMNALVAVATLFVLVYVVSLLSYANEQLERVVEGTPTILVQHGQLVTTNLNKERVPPAEIFGEMRKAGLEELSQVKWAVLEADGKISIVAEDAEEQGRQAQSQEAALA